jgi:hypothetical protein
LATYLLSRKGLLDVDNYISTLNNLDELTFNLCSIAYRTSWLGIFTTFIYYNQKDNIELYFNSIENSDDNIIVQRIIGEKTDIEPTTENPFMNINLITDNKEKQQAPKSWNNTELQKDIENKFNYNLYRDVGDLYGKSNSQREYYTMPATTIPNEQTAFAKWCYSVGPTCKEDSIYCSPEMPQVPYISTNNVYLGTNVKY